MKGTSGANRGRQPSLFRLDNPLVQRFGPSYFATLPTVPGVYRFFDDTGRLLYIGQSSSLRARLGSYRHVTPDRHPRRTLRLVARIHRIEWEICTSAAEAVERERVLLLEHRPPFNRAGTWQGAPWWLAIEATPTALVLGLRRDSGSAGPLPPSFRYVFGSLARCLYRATFPGLPLHCYPTGLMKPVVPMSLTLPFANVEEALQVIDEVVAGNVESLLLQLDALPSPSSPQQEEFWLGEREQLMTWARKSRRRVPAGQASHRPDGKLPLLL